MSIPYLYEATGAIIAFVGLFSLSHRNIKKDAREVIDFKIAPLQVDIHGLTKRIDRIETKIDQVLACVNK